MKIPIWIPVLILCALLAIPALGAPIKTTEPTPVAVIMATAGNRTEVRLVSQMDTVYWNETIDARLVMGWRCTLKSAQTGQVVEVCDVQKNLFIDPEIFDEGEWDQWYPVDDESHANLVAFYVEKFPPPFIPGVYENATAPNQTINVTGTPPGNLEEIRVSDILIPRGFPFYYDINSTGYFDPEMETRAWIFGNHDMLPDISTSNNMLEISMEQSRTLQTGQHSIFLIQGGPNLILEEKIMNEMDSDSPDTAFHIESPFRRVESIEIGGTLENPGIPPMVLANTFQTWLSENTDDDVMQLVLQVEEPSIEIKSIDEIYPNNQTVWYVRGYTNLPNGTAIEGIVDEGDQISINALQQATVSGEVFGADPGAMRQFAIALPVDLDNMPKGQHFVTVRSSVDVYSTVPRWVYDIPEGQEKPVLMTKYSGGNLFVPTPAPEIQIVEKEVPGPTEYIYVTVTPEPTPTPDPLIELVQSPVGYLVALIGFVAFVFVLLWLIYKIRH